MSRGIGVVVLLGPPGSGKSTVAEELAGRGFRWRDWEPEIVERWGSRKRFVARKAVALPDLHEAIMQWVAAGGSPAVVETTGLSDAPLLEALEREHPCLVVRLDVSEETALRRTAARKAGRHLTDDLDATRAIWRAFHEVAAGRGVDLVVDTERRPPAEIAATIRQAVATAGG